MEQIGTECLGADRQGWDKQGHKRQVTVLIMKERGKVGYVAQIPENY